MRIYLINQVGTQYYKIGITKKNISERIQELQIGNANKLQFVDEFNTTYDFKLETYLHNHFRLKRINLEWFELTTEDVAMFQTICLKGEDIFGFLKRSENPFI